MKFRSAKISMLLLHSLTFVIVSLQATEKPMNVSYPTALFDFEENGTAVKGYGKKVTDLLFASLIARGDIYLVERADIQKVLAEAELTSSGMISPDQAPRIGQLTGVKLFITGSVMEVGNSVVIVAKIVSTETSRVVGDSVKGNSGDGLDVLVNSLADKIAELLRQKSADMVATPQSQENLAAQLGVRLHGKTKPPLLVAFTERHVGQQTVDPAAQTEFILVCREAGFDVYGPDKDTAKIARVVIDGEAFSEFAVRIGNLVSVKARVEVYARDPISNKIIAVDRQVSIAVDLAEQIAAKKALEDAAAQIALRMLPKLVNNH